MLQVSHLLTHIASKGHLSNYFRLNTKAQSGQDADARQLIDDYAEWWDEYNLQDLVQERMAQKESKSRLSGGTSVKRSPTPGR